jgi:hypothetical protein
VRADVARPGGSIAWARGAMALPAAWAALKACPARVAALRMKPAMSIGIMPRWLGRPGLPALGLAAEGSRVGTLGCLAAMNAAARAAETFFVAPAPERAGGLGGFAQVACINPLGV